MEISRENVGESPRAIILRERGKNNKISVGSLRIIRLGMLQKPSFGNMCHYIIGLADVNKRVLHFN